MLKLIKNAELYSPRYEGKRDILISAGKIAAVEPEIDLRGYPVTIVDAYGKLVTPGFIDNHVHIIGGGGEGGFHTRTPQIKFSDLVRSGITTVIGCLGTDGICRNMSDLFAKAKALEEEGITSYIYSGSYKVPPLSLTQSIERDIIFIDKIIGIGEIAISDHRSSQPTFEEICRLSSQARISGILSGKAGIVNIHLGNGKGKLKMLQRIIHETEIPYSQFLPTHLNRSSDLLENALEYAKKGGFIDFTTSHSAGHTEKNEILAYLALIEALRNNVPQENITFSSDGQGSLPIFDRNGNFLKLGIGSTLSLFEQVREAVINGIELQEALQVITSNPARILKLHNKGMIKQNMDADFVFLTRESLRIDTVIAKGKILMQNSTLKITPIFE